MSTLSPLPSTSEEASTRQSHGHRVVLTVRGIRDFGEWQKRLGQLLPSENVTYCDYDAGWFDVVSFAIPFARWRAVRRFRQHLLDHLSFYGDASRLDIVAHSFGTYIVAHALRQLKEDTRLQVSNLILCGSVLPDSFRWGQLFASGRVKRVINECGIYDVPLVASQLLVLGTGMAGKTGFPNANTENFVNRYHPCGHSGFFTDDFIAGKWRPILTDDALAKIPLIDDRPQNPTVWQRLCLTFLNHFAIPKLLGYAAIPLAVFLLFLNSKLRGELQIRRLDSSRLAVQYANLADSTRIALNRRDSTAVMDSLFETLASPAPDERIQATLRLYREIRKIDPTRQSSKELERQLESLSMVLDEGQGVLGDDAVYWHTKGLLHCQLYLNSGADQQIRLMQEAFEEARLCYYKLPNIEANALPLILCMLDYGNSLNSVKMTDKAQVELNEARRLLTNSAPNWLRAEILASLAESLRTTQLEGALDHLRVAVAILKDEECARRSLASYYLSSGWFEMDRWNYAAAQSNFLKSEELFEKLSARDTMDLDGWFHSSHGRILCELYGSGDQDQVVRDLTELINHMRNVYETAQRLAADRVHALPENELESLRGRIFNSMERRGDAQFRPADKASVSRAADFYLQAADYAQGVVSGKDDSEEWKKRRALMLYRSATSFALAENTREASRILAMAQEAQCDLTLPWEKQSLRLNESVAEKIVSFSLLPDEEKAEAATEHLVWFKKTMEGFRDERPARDNLEFVIHSAREFWQHGDEAARRDFDVAMSECLWKLGVEWPTDRHVVSKPVQSKSVKLQQIHPRFNY